MMGGLSEFADALPGMTYSDETHSAPQPSILIAGVSGSGKTDVIRQMLAAGLRGAICDSEGKTERLVRYHPLIVPATSRADISRFLQIMRDPDQRRAWVKARTTGRRGGAWDDVDFAAFESLWEYEWLLRTDLSTEFAGEANRFRKFDEYGNRICNFLRLARDLASSKAVSPIGVIVTAATHMTADKYGTFRETIPLQGTIAPPRLRGYFSYVLHTRATVTEDGTARWLLDTVQSPDGFECKGARVLPPVVDLTTDVGDSTFAEVWQKLVAEGGTDAD